MLDVLDTGSAPVPVPPLGTVLLERRLITEDQLQVGLKQHEWSGRPLAEVLVALGFVSETTVAQARFETELLTEPPATIIPLQPTVEIPPAAADEEARIEELERELRTHQLRLRASDELAAVANARNAELEADVESARAALAAAIPAADEMAAETRAQIDALDRDLQEAHAALGAAAARFEAQERELQALRAENGRLAGELAATVESFHAAYARLQYLESAAPPAAPAPEQTQAAPRRATFTWQT